MSFTLPTSILNLNGQVVKTIELKPDENELFIVCARDKRIKPIEPQTGEAGTINRYVRRCIHDTPIMGYSCEIEIELAEVRLPNRVRRIEACPFIKKGCYYTNRFCQLISGLSRHMNLQAVARHFNLRWETVKNIDKNYLQQTLPSIDPQKLSNLKYIGVDEVARAKGHDYITVVYNMISGQLIWVHEGRTSEVFSSFLSQLNPECAENIEAIAMDMGRAYQAAAKKYLPNADIVFDRFHVMKLMSKAIDNQRRIEFRKADKPGKNLLKGSRFLLLKNRKNLSEKQEKNLSKLLSENQTISSLYVLKEQLQALWSNQTFESMNSALESWCDMANETEMIYMKKFAETLLRHKKGICNYAKHSITSARIEAGNVGIGMIRKRARGITDTEYFKLKVRQLGTPERFSMFYNSA